VAVRAAVVVWHRWHQYCKEQGLPGAPRSWDPEASVYLEDFIDSNNSAKTSAGSAYNKLLWAQRHIAAPISMEGIHKPRPVGRAKVDCGPEQAVPLEPAMLIVLELQASRMVELDDWKAVPALLGSMLAISCVRFAHVQRSAPVALTAAWVQFFAYRGKSKEQGTRSGFSWFCPRFG
jgi:hypothetical protein